LEIVVMPVLPYLSLSSSRTGQSSKAQTRRFQVRRRGIRVVNERPQASGREFVSERKFHDASSDCRLLTNQEQRRNVSDPTKQKPGRVITGRLSDAGYAIWKRVFKEAAQTGRLAKNANLS